MTWEQYALNIAEAVSLRSKDPWKKVGCVLLREDNSIASVGYNGFPAGFNEDWSDRDKRRKFVVHAEQNALRYVRPKECVLAACTLMPCGDCMRALAGYGITRIVYREVYQHDQSALEIADAFGVELISS